MKDKHTATNAQKNAQVKNDAAYAAAYARATSAAQAKGGAQAKGDAPGAGAAQANGAAQVKITGLKKPSDQKPSGQKKASKRCLWRRVFIVAAIVLVLALIALGVIFFSYFQGQQKYNEIADKAAVETTNDKTQQMLSLGSMTVDWDYLRGVNPDIVGWVFVPNTVINYPVVQGRDNDYYLTHDFDGAEGSLTQFGAVFMDARNNADWSDEGYFIYGHHMNDGSMFAAIAQMANQEVFDNARIIYLLTPEGNFKLRTFSLLNWSGEDSLVQPTFETEQAFNQYVEQQIRSSIVNPGIIPPVQDIKKFFAFVTCTSYGGGRYVLYSYIEETTVPDSILYKLYD